MEILFNCTTNLIGGGVKNSAFFIKYAIQDKSIRWHFAISPQVKEILDRWQISTDKMHLFKVSPATSMVQRKSLLELSEGANIDLIYTMAGPTYVDFKKHHVLGLSDAYITHADWQGISVGRNILQALKMILLISYKSFWSRKADHWIFQTKVARDGYLRRCFVNRDKTSIVSNSVGNEFIDRFDEAAFSPISTKRTVKILCPAVAYYHKALHVIPEIANELKKVVRNEYSFKFVLTIKSDSNLWNRIINKSISLNVMDSVETISCYGYADAVKVHLDADCIFVPSVLETFSASYLEGFASKRPLIVSKKKFSREICKDAAIYVDPLKPVEAANKINSLILDSQLQKQLIKKGSKVLNIYGDQKERYKNIINIVTSLKFYH